MVGSQIQGAVVGMLLACAPMFAQEVHLHSSVIGAGGVSHARELLTNHQLSSTVGQVFISPHVLQEQLNRYEGFWVPWPSAVVSVDDEDIVATLSAYPNPFSASTRVVITEEIANDVEVALYSLTGERVRSISVQNIDAVERTVEVTSNDDNDVPLASGQYICLVAGRNQAGARVRAYTAVTILK